MKSDASTPASLLDQLCDSSIPYQDPLTRIDWQALDKHAFWLPEQAMSLYGVPEFMSSPLEQRMKLSQYEFMNLLEINLWLEGLLMSRLCDSMRAHSNRQSLACYQLHELREEAGHSLMFLELIQRSGLERVFRGQQQLRWFEWLRRHASLASPLYWAVTLIVEELPDRMHRLILRDTHSLCPVIVKMTKIHAIDESRHITHASRILATIIKPLNRYQKATLGWLLQRLLNQFIRTYYFPAPDCYDLAGLMPGRSWAALAGQNQHRHQLIQQQLETTLRPLTENGITLVWRA